VKKIRLFDTSLRDGEQGIGNLMTVEQKVEIAAALDSINMDVLELGYPAASESDFQWFREARTLDLKTKVCAFSRMTDMDIDMAIAALDGFKAVEIELLAVGSEIHLMKKRRLDLQAAVCEMERSIRRVRASGVDVVVIFEDATRGSWEYLKEMIETAVAAGVKEVVIADTLGCSVPFEIGELVNRVRAVVGDGIELSIHCHNDLGLATANTLEALRCGASTAQVTLTGIGERAGNCALEEIIAVLNYKDGVYGVFSTIEPKAVVAACESLQSVLGRRVPGNKPVLGDHVFSTAAGIHQSGTLRDTSVYEFLQAERFGRQQSFVFNRLSGHAGIEHTLKQNCVTFRSDSDTKAFVASVLRGRRQFTEEELVREFRVFQETPLSLST